MSENDMTTEAERRLTGALDRLEAALTGPGSAADLAAKLAEEKTVTAQLSERITALKAELADAQSAATDAALPTEDLSEIVAERDVELAGVRAALAEAHSNTTAELEAMRADHAAALAAKDAEIDRIHVQADAMSAAAAPMVAADPGDIAALTELSEVTAELRATAVAGATDVGLINRALEAEVEALRVARQADLEEMRTLLAELEPMLEESANA
jgi:hypothetical protein